MKALVRNGLVYDGTDTPPERVDLLVGEGGSIEEVGPGLECPEGARVIDAEGCWVTPGFLDIHTHYDAELEVAPGLTESLRHGVTTVLIGSCGLSMVTGDPEDLADMFCRVEGIPRDVVLPLLRDVVDWDGPAGYAEHLAGLPMGPNVVAMAGHSTVRAAVMGLGRSLDATVLPGEQELVSMERLVEQSIDSGMLGVSANLLPWDKMGGERYRSRPTPSVFARFAEYRRLAEVARRRDAVFQAIPNLQTRWSIFPLMDLSRARHGQPLRTSLLTLADAPPAMGAYRAMAALADRYNRHLGANLRFQALPTPFDMYTDGLENPVIEEFGAGTEALHLEDLEARRALLRAPVYRRRFAKQWRNPIAARAYHRDLAEARVVSTPDGRHDGMTFAEVASRRGVEPIEAFLDLQAQWGNDLRWYSVVANANPRNLEWITTHPTAMIGFSDAGAHLRNMALYNIGLRMLKRVRDAELAGRPFMSVQAAVRRLTSEIAEFHRIDAGRLHEGARADLVVIDPDHLDSTLERIEEAEMPGFPGMQRLVRRNDATVRAVMVNGRVAWDQHGAAEDLGSSKDYGGLLTLGS